MTIMLAIALLTLTGPDNQTIGVNPHEIVSVREPRGVEHFAKDVRCLLHTADGKFIAVTETCDQVRALLMEEERE